MKGKMPAKGMPKGMPPKDMHKMAGGMMMKDSEMKKQHEKMEYKKGKK